MIYLASRSPRRRALLEQIGVAYRTLEVDVCEDMLDGEPPDALARRLALDKARAGVARIAGTDERAPVLGADTVVVIGERMLGKPGNRDDAREMLMALSGREHRVLTAVALARGTHAATRLSETRVRLRVIAAAECDAYVASGEPFDKAGGYGIQGRGGIFVERIEGSYSGVVGLPLCETAALLAEAGIDVLG